MEGCEGSKNGRDIECMMMEKGKEMEGEIMEKKRKGREGRMIGGRENSCEKLKYL